ncbi:MAG TPA: hypothetical protein DCL41_08135 [Bdellovibrionales bacterium]|nr:hypothetical protein [Bdellovibrionales bacterium]
MSAPATAPAGQGRIYFDSTANKFKVSQNNGAYVDLVQSGSSGDFMKDGSVAMTGQFKADDGSLAAPGISFANDTDTGFYRYNTGIRMAVSGSMVLQGEQNAGIRLPGGKGNARVVVGNTCSFVFCVSYVSSSPTVTPTLTDTEQVIGLDRNTSAGQSGDGLYITAGGADSGANNAQGGSLGLGSGLSTGNQGSDILFMTATGAGSGTTDRTPTEKMRIKGSGKVGIGISAPTAKLEVSGQTRSVNDSGVTQTNASTSINWDLGNVQSMSVACTSTTFSNMLDGGTYVLAVTETGTSTCTFSHTGLTFYFSPANGGRESGKRTVYTFQRIGSAVYVSWIKGFQ